MAQGKVLTETLKAIEEQVDGPSITLGEIVETLNNRGFGTLLIGPALVTILPTGAIPGVPALCAVFICLITGQILCGRRYPWMPERLKNIPIRRRKIVSASRLVKPWAGRIEKYIRPRYAFFANHATEFFVALICFFLALLMGLVGFIPFLPALLSMPILFFALGLSAKDGLMTFSGLIFTLAAFAFIFWFTALDEAGSEILVPRPVFVTGEGFKVDLNLFD